MLGSIAERPPHFGRKDADPIPEKLLQRLWQQRAARQESFRTAAGLRVRVLYAGREGKAAGPDFRDAILEFEGQGLVRGDVELHVRQRDWHSHGHSGDPNYNGVVLHAALDLDGDEAATGLHSGRSTPVVSLALLLEPSLLSDAGQSGEDRPGDGAAMGLWELLESRGYPRPGTAGQAGESLDLAGGQRFESNSRRFQLFLSDSSPATSAAATGSDHTLLDQVLFEALMEGLGYKNNQQPFLKLAQCAPWRSLVQQCGNLSPNDRAAAVQGWLSEVSGLVDGPGDFVSPALPKGLGPSMSRREWRLSGLRPANHPLRRIAGAARLVERYSETGLAVSLERAAQGETPKTLTQCLTVAASTGQRVAPVGWGRAADLAVNVVLPFLHAVSGGSTSTYVDLYQSFGKLQENEITREMARLLLDPSWGPLVDSARRQQGLIHLHRVLAGESYVGTPMASGSQTLPRL